MKSELEDLENSSSFHTARHKKLCFEGKFKAVVGQPFAIKISRCDLWVQSTILAEMLPAGLKGKESGRNEGEGCQTSEILQTGRESCPVLNTHYSSGKGKNDSEGGSELGRLPLSPQTQTA